MTDFHFIRPYWLIALVVLFIIAYLLKRLQVKNSGWQQVIPAHLSKKLIDGEDNQQGFSLFIPLIISLLTIISLAGPAWQQLPQPVYNVQKGSVIIMDMSNSMYATDVSPNRLTRARYKAIDLLDQLNEGDTGLIAYAGDSFIISPLTEDINNIKLLLPALSPQLMPVQGSNPMLALTMANEMLVNAGHLTGDIYWLTDEVDQYDVEEINTFVNKINHKINILGIGTQAGAPIKMPDGKLLKDNSGAIVIPALNVEALRGVTQSAKGTYQTLSNDNTDIEALINNALIQEEKEQDKNKEQHLTTGDTYEEAGPYLLLLILPLLLVYFRRGGLVALLPCLMFISTPQPSFAQSSITPNQLAQQTATTKQNEVDKPVSSLWNNLWQTQDQQAQNKYNQQQYAAAAEQFSDSLWQGSAHYKNGNYEQALAAFQQSDSAEALYNQGNSLAKMQKFDEALQAYQKALDKNPNLTSAKENKSLIEELKKQQEQQQKNNQQQNSDEQDQNNSSEQNQSSQQDQQNQQNSDDKPSEQQQNNDTDSENNPTDNEQQNTEPEPDDSSPQTESNDEETPLEETEANEQEQTLSEGDEAKEATEQQLTAAEQAAQEEAQKHQQLLKKVTDDPYLLLRNKMQIEYQKRRNQNSGANKKW